MWVFEIFLHAAVIWSGVMWECVNLFFYESKGWYYWFRQNGENVLG